MGKTPTVLSDDELVMIAHLRMRQLSLASALKSKHLDRGDLTAPKVNSYIAKHFKTWNRFFEAYASKVHEMREQGLLPDVVTTKRKPRGESFYFGNR